MEHILINGWRGVGKSTLVERLLREISIPVYGFITKSLAPDKSGFHPIYIHPAAAQERVYTGENLIGRCNAKQRNVNPGVFDTLGVRYIRCAKPGGLLVMDELGFMEADSPAFLSAVMAAFDGDIPVLATVKAREDISFLNDLRAHPNARVFTLTPENREELYAQLLPIVKGW